MSAYVTYTVTAFDTRDRERFTFSVRASGVTEAVMAESLAYAKGQLRTITRVELVRSIPARIGRHVGPSTRIL